MKIAFITLLILAAVILVVGLLRGGKRNEAENNGRQPLSREEV